MIGFCLLAVIDYLIPTRIPLFPANHRHYRYPNYETKLTKSINPRCSSSKSASYTILNLFLIIFKGNFNEYSQILS